MNTVTTKYDPAQKKSNLKTKSIKKSPFFKIVSKAMLSAEEQELLRVALEARDEWIDTGDNFQYVHEEMLVDYYTYKLKACEARYMYYLKLVKEKGLTRYM